MRPAAALSLLAAAVAAACGTNTNTSAITVSVAHATQPSPFSTATVPAFCAPGAVCLYNVDFDPSSATSAGVHWEGDFIAIDDQGDIGLANYFEYNLRYGPDGDQPSWQQLNYGSDVHDVAIHNLDPNTLYGVIVEGHEGQGSSAWSPWSTQVDFQTAAQGGTVVVQGSGFAAGASVLVALQAVPDTQGALRSVGPFPVTTAGDGSFNLQLRYGVCRPSLDVSGTSTTITAVDQQTLTGATAVASLPSFCDSTTTVPDFFAGP